MRTTDHSRPPQFYGGGLNVLDPKDRLGIKSEYITRLQELALRTHLPAADGLAVDVGCGYGRLSGFLAREGWKVIGIDPAYDLVKYAQRHQPNAAFCVGALPKLPVPAGTARLVLFQNLLRPLLQLDNLIAVKGSGDLVAQGGHLALVDNIWPGNPEFVEEEWIRQTFDREGFYLVKRVPIRAGRWWMLYPIRYGLVSRAWLPKIAEYELRLRSGMSGRERWRYTNVLFLFQRR